MQSFEFLDLFLEDADVVHESDYAVRRHRTGVKSGGGEQWSDVERHGALRRVQDEQLAPAQSQQPDLVRHLTDTVSDLIKQIRLSS